MSTVSFNTPHQIGIHPLVIKALLSAGILSSLLYVFMNIICVVRYPGYDAMTQTVSELSAIDAPARSLWGMLAIVYTLLGIAFSIGVYVVAPQNRRLKAIAYCLFFNSLIGLFWPPMHQRTVLATDGGNISDVLHIIFAVICIVLMLFIMYNAAGAFNNWFKYYTIISIVLLCVFGLLTGIASPKMQANLPTPLMGVWERISIGAYLLWIITFSLLLLSSRKRFIPS